MSQRLIALVAIAALVGLMGVSRATLGTSAQDEPSTLTGHPLVGTWLVQTPGGPSIETFGADGSVTFGWTTSFANEAGDVFFESPGVGVWEPADARSGRFTVVLVYSDANGTYTGTETIDGYLEVSEDGQSWIDDWTHGTTVTDRDPNNVVVSEFVGDASFPPITGTRMNVWDVEFPVATPEA